MISGKPSWEPDQPVWICEVGGSGETWRRLGNIVSVDESGVHTVTSRPPTFFRRFDRNGQSRVYEHSPLPDAWLEPCQDRTP
jgi:hypothetical protein